MARYSREKPGSRATNPQGKRRRRGRKTHRRDVRRGYFNPLDTHPEMAQAGVSSRLRLAAVTGSFTWICGVAAGMLWGAPFTVAVLAILALTSLSATIALILSARREEVVHRIAVETEPLLLEPPMGYDGDAN